MLSYEHETSAGADVIAAAGGLAPVATMEPMTASDASSASNARNVRCTDPPRVVAHGCASDGRSATRIGSRGSRPHHPQHGRI